MPEYDPLTISDEDLKALPPSDRAKVYKARAQAAVYLKVSSSYYNVEH